MNNANDRHVADPLRRLRPGQSGTVLDAIADAFSILLVRPWLAAVPLLTDLVLWLFIRVPMKPLTDRIAETFVTSNVDNGSEAAQTIRDAGETVMASNALSAFLPSVFSGLPVDSLLNVLAFLFVPGAASGVGNGDLAERWRGGVTGALEVTSSGSVLIVLGAMLLLGTALSSLYRVPMARLVRGAASVSFVHEWLNGWARTLSLIVIVALGLVVAFVPIMIASMALVILQLNLLFVAVVAVLIGGGILSVLSWFTVNVMFLHQVGPVRAIRQSTKIARASSGPTARFAFLSMFLLLAALHLWSTTVSTLPGIALAIAGNALLGTGLTLASMLFYADRFRPGASRSTSSR